MLPRFSDGIIYGLGDERYAHTVFDQAPAADVIQVAQFYACLSLALGNI